MAIAGVRLLIYKSGNAPAARRGGIRDLARQGDDHEPLEHIVIRREGGIRAYLIVAEAPAGAPGSPADLRTASERQCPPQRSGFETDIAAAMAKARQSG